MPRGRLTRSRAFVWGVLGAAVAAAACARPAAPAANTAPQGPQGSDARAARVARGLLPPVRVRGRTYAAATIDERMRSRGVPAVSVAVIDSGRVVWARAYGLADVAAGRAATVATLFQAASMSKPVAATAALQLVQEGRLALDDDVNARLTSWKVPQSALSAAAPVTLRGLVTHSAGLTVHGFRGYAAGEGVPTPAQLLDGAPPANSAPVRVDLAPGTRWRYSGGGYTVMQLLLTDVTGEPFPELLRRRVLAPAGMTSSTYEQPLPAARALDAATGYRPNGSPVAGRYHAYPEMAAAGLWTTPTDLARWIIAVQRSAEGAPSAFLSRATAEAMLTPGVGGHGLGPGLGGAGDSLHFSHGGANEGFRGTFVGFARRGQGAVVMTNSDAGGGLANEVIAAVAREYGWPGFAPREVVPIALGSEALAEYRGAYAPGGGSPVRVTVAPNDSGGLAVTIPGRPPLEILPTARDRFADAASAAEWRFERGPDGRVAALIAGNDRLVRVP